MTGLNRWIRWELQRRIAVTLGLRLIVVDRVVKVVVLLGAGLALLIANDWLHQAALAWQEQLNLQPQRGFFRSVVETAAVRFGLLPNSTRVLVAFAALLYAALEIVEALGIWFRRRWAEYLVLLATAIPLPFEAEALARHPTLFKSGAFLVNATICVYLVWRKRLFLERPPADFQ